MQPIEYPKVVLRDGSIYLLRMSLRSLRLLKQWGIDSDTPKDSEDAWAQLSGQVAACAYHPSESGGYGDFANLDPKRVDEAYQSDPTMFEMTDLRAAVNDSVTFRPPSGVVSSQPEKANAAT